MKKAVGGKGKSNMIVKSLGGNHKPGAEGGGREKQRQGSKAVPHDRNMGRLGKRF